ncbi:hypothetical protein [Haladaptatus sp. CMAA 1911]|uniref:hypothetical protein n=1 Tax=unclassified Haladaptatus TaxID=2622732 RepID=UPI0037546B70
MTVGIAVIADAGTNDPKVIVAADRMLTTQQQSRIEHEHPGTKISPLTPQISDAELLTVFAGSVSLAEELKKNIESAIFNIKNQNNQQLTVRDFAKISASQYRYFVQEKIENVVLSTYGLEMDDLSKQHQFKDSFFNNVLAEIESIENQITQNLVMLLGGVDDMGGHIYQIGNNDVNGHNDMGYATIGSGTQPAQSEFIKSGYGKNETFDSALATVAAANHRAKQASGVGGNVDISVVNRHITNDVGDETIDNLMERQKDIAYEQEEVKQSILKEETIEWRLENDTQ